LEFGGRGSKRKLDQQDKSQREKNDLARHQEHKTKNDGHGDKSKRKRREQEDKKKKTVLENI